MTPFYISEVDATEYLTYEMNSEAWFSATIAEREKALISSERAIDRLNYEYDKTVDTQTNEFPRNEETVVPLDIGYATCLNSLSLLDGKDDEIEREQQLDSTTSMGFANVRSGSDKSHGNSSIRNGIMSIRAWSLLQPFLADPHDLELVRVD